MRPCIYLSGPMTGYPDLNFPAFNRAANALRAVGFPVINPADFGVQDDETWASCLKRDIHVLVSCQQVVTLDGWEQSKGARLECHIARELGIQVTSFAEFALGVPPCSTDSCDDLDDGSDTESGPSLVTSPSPTPTGGSTLAADGKPTESSGCNGAGLSGWDGEKFHLVPRKDRPLWLELCNADPYPLT